MKQIILCVLTLSLISCSTLTKKRKNLKPLNIPTKEEFDTIALTTFQLKNIDTITYKYNNIFYMEKDSSIYKIVTKKEKISPCEKVSMNNFYDLKILGNFPEVFRNITIITHLIMYENEYVTIERNPQMKWDMYVTPYIRGFCYIQD